MISEETRAYYDLKKRNDVRESAKRIRRQFLRYKDAEIIYSLQHKKILELASAAGAIYRMDGTVLINRDTQVKHGGTRSCGCKAMEHITDLRKQDITGERFGRLTAVRPTEQRDNNGSVIWELRCDCGNLTYKTVNALKSGRVLSCGCKYRETRSETVKHRRDMVEGTNVSNIVASKHLRSNNTSGHTGVGLDRRTGKWYAYINFQKKHYNLGLHKDKSAAIRARRAAEARLHDPVILEYWDSLTEKRKKEFQDYLRSTNK